MRISDWSSDVCSSDLGETGAGPRPARRAAHPPFGTWIGPVEVPEGGYVGGPASRRQRGSEERELRGEHPAPVAPVVPARLPAAGDLAVEPVDVVLRGPVERVAAPAVDPDGDAVEVVLAADDGVLQVPQIG